MRMPALIALFAGLAACGDSPEAKRPAPGMDVDARSQVGSETGESSPRAERRQSVYTPLDEQHCRLLEENRDEGPYWRRRCPGAGGYWVEWTESDLRQGLEVIDPKGVKTSLDLSGIAAKGAFNRLGPRIEWRGEEGVAPDVLVVRIFVADGSRPDAPDRSLLAVARLTPKPCLTALVEPGAAQSDDARAAADSPGECLKRPA